MECSICLENVSEDKRILKCGHEFHTVCIDLWFNEKKECPVCRTSLETQNENLEQPIEDENFETVRVQSLTNAEGILFIASFMSLSLSLITMKENEIFLLLFIQSFIYMGYTCRKISIHIIKLFALYILFSFVLDVSLYKFNYKKYNYILIFSIFLLQYIFVHIVEKERRLENN
jgi:hypothetical protein